MSIGSPAPFHTGIACGPTGGHARWLTTHDNVTIRVGAWASPPQTRGTVFIFTGRTEYIEKYGPAAQDLFQRGYGCVSIDWRGQGLSDRALPDRAKGHVGHFDEYQNDTDAVLAWAHAADLPQPWFVLAHSMGATIALRRLMQSHPFRACALSSPMLGIKLPAVLGAVEMHLARGLSRFGPVTSYPPAMGAHAYVLRASFKNNLLTTDKDMWDFMVMQLSEVPELALGAPSFSWAAEGILECARLAAMPAPALPCYCAIGTHERVVRTDIVVRRMNDWPAGRFDQIVGAQHEIMMETPARRARFFDAVCAGFDRGGQTA
ncbi:alpha/beta hydrolase [Rhodobacteraceae bacterium]|nr:alpha/beta hydrolase [Paracoccaceae bacterium]